MHRLGCLWPSWTDGRGRDTTVKRCQGGGRLRESQHAVKGTKGKEMGDDIVEMTVWGQGAEESGKTGCTGWMRSTWSKFHLGLTLILAIYLHFAQAVSFHKNPLPPNDNGEHLPRQRTLGIILAELPGGCPASDPRGVGDRNTGRATAHPTHLNSYITHLSCLTHAKPGRGPDPSPSRGHPRSSAIAFGRSLVSRRGRMAKIDGLGEEQEGQNGITTHQ